MNFFFTDHFVWDFLEAFFFPSGSSDNPTQVAPKARVVRIDRWVGGWVVIKLSFYFTEIQLY